MRPPHRQLAVGVVEFQCRRRQQRACIAVDHLHDGVDVDVDGGVQGELVCAPGDILIDIDVAIGTGTADVAGNGHVATGGEEVAQRRARDIHADSEAVRVDEPVPRAAVGCSGIDVRVVTNFHPPARGFNKAAVAT